MAHASLWIRFHIENHLRYGSHQQSVWQLWTFEFGDSLSMSSNSFWSFTPVSSEYAEYTLLPQYVHCSHSHLRISGLPLAHVGTYEVWHPCRSLFAHLLAVYTSCTFAYCSSHCSSGTLDGTVLWNWQWGLAVTNWLVRSSCEWGCPVPSFTSVALNRSQESSRLRLDSKRNFMTMT